MRLEVTKAFLTQEECDALNAWALQGVTNGWVSTGTSSVGLTRNRLTSRMYGYRFTTPKIVKDVSKKVRSHVGVSTYPIIGKHGRDGAVVTCTYDGGDVHIHRDPRNFPKLATLRCNVMTQKPESGGVLHIENEAVEIDVGDLHCYLVSEHPHYVTTVSGEIPRILWMFGACVPADDWNSGRIELGETCGVS